MNSRLTTTYSPCGQRPVMHINSNVTKRLFVASAISAEGDLFFHHRLEPYNTDAIIEFLMLLLHSVTNKILIVWDGASIHRSKKLKEFLTSYQQADRLLLFIQPPYSPQVNADELVWQRIKNVALKNSCFQNFKELKDKVLSEIKALSENRDLIKNFFRHPEVAYY